MYEPAGATFLEAMAADKPVIASRIDGIMEVVEDGKNGLLFEAGNDEDLAAKIRELLNDNSLRVKIVSNIETTKNKYDWEYVSKEWLALFSTHKKNLKMNGEIEK